jgi:hypothetical protein
MNRLTKRPWLMVLPGVVATLAVVVFGKWRDATKRGGQQPAEPFRIAGNLYYVGANDVTSFLLTGPEGHVLIDGGYAKCSKTSSDAASRPLRRHNKRLLLTDQSWSPALRAHPPTLPAAESQNRYAARHRWQTTNGIRRVRVLRGKSKSIGTHL